MKNKQMIHEVLQDSNEVYFSPLSMKVVLLKEVPEHIPELAQWVYDEWRFYDASLTKEKVIQSLKTRLRDDGIPFTLVALKGKTPVGIVSLKEKEDSEFTDLSEGNPWLGSLLVAPVETNNGLEQELLNIATTIAEKLGYGTVYVYTSNKDKVGLFLKNGAKVVETRPFRGHTITIMNIPLA